ncbi:MAG TPA: hypothetical protein DCK87_00400 [Desulfotomaculum sp.]|nr:hypothetical protein [Desulfotomaculum sp.]
MDYQMLKMERKKKIEEEIKRIAGSFSAMNIKKALLFGSAARNEIGINDVTASSPLCFTFKL